MPNETDDTIETPLSSGATDNPDAPQSGGTQANNEASATAAGYPVQHAQPSNTANPASTKTLAQLVKAKYTEYADMDDATLESKILAKYPEYANVPRTKTAPNAGLSRPQLPNPIQQSIDEQTSDRAAGAAGPLNKPGAAEKAMGENTSELDTLKSLGTATAATAGGAVGAEFSPEIVAALKVVAQNPLVKAVLKGAAHAVGAGSAYKISKALGWL
jgi:hypothetical protein